MNVYFTASVAARPQYLTNYEAITQYLWGKGHQVAADHVMGDGERNSDISTRAERIKLQQKIEQSIRSADFVIAEVSFPSISVGYEICYALQIERPVLVLYAEGDPPNLLGIHRDSKVMMSKYEKLTIPKILDEFIGSIVSRGELRFTFFITPQIAAYLETVAKQQRLPKAVYLRKLIERQMRQPQLAE